MLKQPLNQPIGHNKYKLAEDYIASFTIKGVKVWLTVPRGFINDGASIPSVFYWFMRRDGLTRGPALAHDYLYRKKGNMYPDLVLKDNAPYGEILSRAEADEAFKQLLVKAGFSKFKAYTAWLGVRAGGWVWY